MFPCECHVYKDLYCQCSNHYTAVYITDKMRSLLVVCSLALLNSALSQHPHGPLPDGPHGIPNVHGPLPDGPHGFPDVHGPLPDGPHGIPNVHGPLPDGPHGIPNVHGPLPDGPRVPGVVGPLLNGPLPEDPFVDPFTAGVIPETGVWKSHRIPLNNPDCKVVGPNYDPKAIFDDSFVCDKSAEKSLPINPTVWDDRHPDTLLFETIFNDTVDFETDETIGITPVEHRATTYYDSVYNALVLDDFGKSFQQCASRPRYYNPPETAKYKVKKTCETVYTPLHERAIWQRVGSRQVPCYIPVPNELWTVSCHSPINRNDDRCRLGYIGYDEFRCIPSNFVERTIVVSCPSVKRMFKRTFSVPTTCSCKMCYSCANGVTYDVRGPGFRAIHGRRNRRLGRKRDGIPVYAVHAPNAGGRGGRIGGGRRLDPIIH